MIAIRKADERGYFKNEWLTSFHTFSFGEYYDLKHMHFNHLRVINEDYIAPAMGFAPHNHQDMEIMTYIISGELAHKDSMGNSSIIKSGEVQFMRAGTQVTHSEFNPSRSTETHLLQIWIIPDKKGLMPTYSQHFYSEEDKRNKFCLLASYKANESLFQIAQKVNIYASILEQHAQLNYSLETKGDVWVQVVRGSLQMNNITVSAGDGIGIRNEFTLKFAAHENTEFLLFDFS